MDVIKKDVLERSVYGSLLTGYDENLVPQYGTADAFLDMAALIVSQNRAS